MEKINSRALNIISLSIPDDTTVVIRKTARNDENRIYYLALRSVVENPTEDSVSIQMLNKEGNYIKPFINTTGSGDIAKRDDLIIIEF